MSDNYCRVYDKEALRMLVVENELEERARIKKQNSLNAKKSGSKSVSVKRSSLVASESEKQLREKERADVRYQRFKYAQQIREKKEKLEKKERMEAAAKRKEDLFRYWNGRVNDPEEKAQVQAVHKWLDQHQAKEEQNCASCMKRGIKYIQPYIKICQRKVGNTRSCQVQGDGKKRVPKLC